MHFAWIFLTFFFTHVVAYEPTARLGMSLGPVPGHGPVVGDRWSKHCTNAITPLTLLKFLIHFTMKPHYCYTLLFCVLFFFRRILFIIFIFSHEDKTNHNESSISAVHSYRGGSEGRKSQGYLLKLTSLVYKKLVNWKFQSCVWGYEPGWRVLSCHTVSQSFLSPLGRMKIPRISLIIGLFLEVNVSWDI